VSFSFTNDDYAGTPVRIPTPELTWSTSNQRPSSSKITITGILPASKHKNNNEGLSFGSKIENDYENDSSLVPTPNPTMTRPISKSRPSSEGEKVKISLSFPSSLGKTKEVEVPSSSTANSLGFKPIQYYTDVPTVPASSSEPDAKGKKEKHQDKGKMNSLSPTAITLTDEPTFYVYPTFSPSYVESNNNSTLSNYPTYSPTYMPTQQTTERPPLPSVVFGSATGRENNFSVMDSITPQRNETFNLTVSDDQNIDIDIVAIKPFNITSNEEDGNIQGDEDQEHSTNPYQKRICPGLPLGVNPAVAKVEQEVFFTYGIETRDNLEEVVNKLQMRILEDAAQHILRCNNHQSGSPVSRVYFSRNMAISTLSKFD
jgi:hypothetical protein